MLTRLGVAGSPQATCLASRDQQLGADLQSPGMMARRPACVTAADREGAHAMMDIDALRAQTPVARAAFT